MTETVPVNLEAERAVLGAILLSNARMLEAQDTLCAEDFYRAAHGHIFRVIAKMLDRGQAVDMVILREALATEGLLESVGGPLYVASLIDGLPHSSNVKHYATIVKTKARLRALMDAAMAMLRDAVDESEPVEDILGRAEQAVLGLSQGQKTRGLQRMADIASRGMDAMEAAASRKKAVAGVPSGFAALDTMLRGFQPGTLVTIAARPGMGKTSFVLNALAYAATVHQIPCAMWSLEMQADELFLRQVSSLARVDSYRIQSGFLRETDWTKIGQAVGTLANAPMLIDESPAASVMDIRSRARRAKAEHGIRLVAVDYLQLMSSPVRGQNRNLEVGEITRALKGLAKELNVPVLMLSQLNRDVDKQARRPRLSDLRDSGSIEQDSDVVMFIHRDEGVEDVADIVVEKHRQGATGTVQLRWVREETRFANLTEESC